MEDLFQEETEGPVAEKRGPEESQFTPEYLVFRLGSVQCAFPVIQIKEVSEGVAITPVPNVPPAIAGVINLRGSVLPVLDLKNLLALPSLQEGRQILILRREPSVGLLIGETVQIMPFIKTEIRPLSPQESEGYGHMVLSGVEVQGRSILLLDAESLMESKAIIPS